MRVFMEMKRSSVRPDVVAYTSLLAALQGTPQVSAGSSSSCKCLVCTCFTMHNLVQWKCGRPLDPTSDLANDGGPQWEGADDPPA
jgi:hypothetical protein